MNRRTLFKKILTVGAALGAMSVMPDVVQAPPPPATTELGGMVAGEMYTSQLLTDEVVKKAMKLMGQEPQWAGCYRAIVHPTIAAELQTFTCGRTPEGKAEIKALAEALHSKDVVRGAYATHLHGFTDTTIANDPTIWSDAYVVNHPETWAELKRTAAVVQGCRVMPSQVY